MEAAARRLARLADDVLEVLGGDDDLDPDIVVELVLQFLITEDPELLRRPLPPLHELIGADRRNVYGG